MKLCVLGAGAWGTALAIHAASRHETWLWARDAALVERMARSRLNDRYLPDSPLPGALHLTARLDEAVHGASLIVIATSVAGLRATMQALRALDMQGQDTKGLGTRGLDTPDSDSGRIPVVWLSKGFEAGSGAFAHEIAAELLPGRAHGMLTGPSFAQEVAAGLPVALTAASPDDALQQLMVDVFHHQAMRVYRSADLSGVEVCGALKNVIAIATGICDGMSLGHNARAALITRGLAEMTRLGVATGASRETFLGLAGVGDLLLTCTGNLSRNRRVGLQLGEGRALEQILESLGHVAEGVVGCSAALRRARGLGVELPICSAVLGVLEGRLRADDAARQLMARDPRGE